MWRFVPDLPPPVPQAGSKKRTQKVTAEMRRKAALQRKVDREERAFGTRKEREEIFEVGLGKCGGGGTRPPCSARSTERRQPLVHARRGRRSLRCDRGSVGWGTRSGQEEILQVGGSAQGSRQCLSARETARWREHIRRVGRSPRGEN